MGSTGKRRTDNGGDAATGNKEEVHEQHQPTGLRIAAVGPRGPVGAGRARRARTRKPLTRPTSTLTRRWATGSRRWTAQDVTFNQLLGINNQGTIAGYFGSGARPPEQGLPALPPYGQGNYVNENFPGSAQTQVTGLNDKGTTVGFWSSMNNANMVNDNFGVLAAPRALPHRRLPTGDGATPPVDQLLGVNDDDVVVGFWTDADGNNHGYKVDTDTGRFRSVTDPSAPGASLTAAAISNRGDIAGFYTNPTAPPTASSWAAAVHRPGRPRRGVHRGARRGRRRRGSRHVHGGERRRRGDARVHLDAGRRLHHRRRPARHGHHHGQRRERRRRLVGFYADAAGNTDGFLATR